MFLAIFRSFYTKTYQKIYKSLLCVFYMLIDFSIENFTSIKDKITFSLESTASKKLSKNIIENSPSLVKKAMILGANASGKSNLIKGIGFIRYMVTTSNQFNIDNKIPTIPYKFDKKSIKNPSKFEVNFVYDEIRYRYGFSCTDKEITEEYLYYWIKNKEILIFKRNEKNMFRFRKDSARQKKYSSQTIPNVLYVSRATQLGNEKTKPVYEFFSHYLIINTNLSWHQYTLESMSNNPKIKEEIINILKKSDFGGINDIVVKKEKSQIKEITFGIGKENPKIIDSVGDVLDVKFVHKINDEQVSLNLYEESAGTIKTLDLLGPFLDILENGRVVIIDELESSLHPEISNFLVKLFTSKHNKKNAQLIFTTHNTSFLDNKLFRKDQVHFCEKKPNNATELISLSDFDIRQDADFEKAYKEGRFGGVPFIDETYTN